MIRRACGQLLVLSLIGCSQGGTDASFQSLWPQDAERVWIGPEYWSNPLQDWRVRNGRLECVAAGGDQNVFLLTRDVDERDGDLIMSVRLGRLEEDREALSEGFVGFRVGIRGAFHDYRDSAVRGHGLNAGLAWDGRLFIGRLESDAPAVSPPFENLELRFRAEAAGAQSTITLSAYSPDGEQLAEVSRDDVLPAWLTGGLALVASSGEILETPPPGEDVIDPGWSGKQGTAREGNLRFWFSDWRVSGTKLTAHDERAFGPILFAMHTLGRGVLKLTAQMAPLGNSSKDVRLEARDSPESEWRQISETTIDPQSRTARFRIANWDATRDTPYRVVYTMPDGGGAARDYTYEGTIRKDPVGKESIVVAAFTGNNDLGFPHADVVRNVRHFEPDVLAYTGDNIYERVGEYGTQRTPLDAAILDYLRKWYLFGWEYGELLKDIPAICLPDDHDVYHGNLWGAGGRHAEGRGFEGQDKGGYTMPAPFVNAVQRTQTSHLPDPHDPTPVEQDISVYYAALLYGGVSFAILEDRKWKSAPTVALPKAEIINGWAQNPSYDAARDGDLPGAELLGQRQIDFLNEWAADWSGGAWMKVVVSQTIFANLATLPKGRRSDAVTPKLQVMQPGEYAAGEEQVQDHDSNGWPQTPRNTALRAMRRGFAFHIAGDQHLGSTIQYGVDDWNDASWAVCVPSVANVWPRRWYPSAKGKNRQPDGLPYSGEFLDGFGNKMTVYAVSNPTRVDVEPAALHNRAPGYGIVTFDRTTRRITIANWPRWVDATETDAKPYEGWPITIDQTGNGMPTSGWELTEISEPEIEDFVVQVIRQVSGEIVYTLRIRGSSFTPQVFEPGTYTVRVMDPDRDFEKVHRDLEASQSR